MRNGSWACFSILAILLATCGRCPAESISADLLVVGATESGWAASIQAARMGVEKIVIVHDGNWIGGQFTEQALACVDENKGVGKIGWGVDWHPMKRSFHRFGLFKELMDRVEKFNQQKYGSPMPGRPHHGPSTFRPAEAESIFRYLLQPYIDNGQVRLIESHYPVSAVVERSGSGARLRSVEFAPIGKDEGTLNVAAAMTIDASDWGEVIQVAGAAYECGPDPADRYKEPSAPKSFPANEMNPITWPMIVVESKMETPIPKPDRFDDRCFPRATHLSRSAFGNLKWDVKASKGSIPHWPNAGEESPRQLSVYNVRRIVDGRASRDGTTSILLNYMNGQDYPLERLPAHVVEALEKSETGASLKNIVEMTRGQRQIIFDDAKRHALCLLYHLQNFVHDRADDQTNSFRRFHLSEEFGTSDRLPPKPYIRESLRLKAMYMMREQDSRNRDGITKRDARPRFASVIYPDGLFSWQFHYDFHRTGRTYLKEEGPAGPWIDYHKPNRHTSFLSDRSEFPMRSLIPKSMDGLLGAQGNVGYSSIVSAAIRLHDQRIHIGQAAGATAAVSLQRMISPRRMVYKRDEVEAVRDALCAKDSGQEPVLLWPFRDLPTSHPDFIAINRLAVLQLIPIQTYQVDFRPDDQAEFDWIDEVVKRCRLDMELLQLEGQSTRGQLCSIVWPIVQSRGWSSFQWHRDSSEDADGDGILDLDDALLFTPNQPVQFSLERPALTEQTDGIPALAKVPGTRRFDFCGSSVAPAAGFTADRGKPFSKQNGFGWSRDMTKNHRVRQRLKGPRDSFLFTRDTDSWKLRLPNGTYQVTVCIGDSAHPQPGQTVQIESVEVIPEHDTGEGEFLEHASRVVVHDQELKVVIGSGRQGSNTCLAWIIVEPVAN